MPNEPDSAGLIQILLLIAILIPAILFLLSQQRTLEAIATGNRSMNPGLVWLQLIPLLGQIWQFFVVIRISESIQRQFMSRQDDSILGVPDAAAVEEFGKKPTFGIGIAYCTLSVIGLLINFVARGSSLSGLFTLSGMVCWIIYWVQLAGYKNKIVRLNSFA